MSLCRMPLAARGWRPPPRCSAWHSTVPRCPDVRDLRADNQVTALAGVEGLVALQTLELRNNKCSLRPTGQLSRAGRLNNLAGLALPGLEKLSLSGNLLRATEGLEGSPLLKQLELDGNRLEVVAGLGEGHEQLTAVNLRRQLGICTN